ncbi:isoprenoid synthase domain-containing protein [Amylostereum chailletii]|nr:isoprenoid synthase domain-containing protein [Amylostereum chailletii]
MTFPPPYTPSVPTFVLPDLVSHCPFPLLYHPHGDAIAAESLAWIIGSIPTLPSHKIKAMRGLQAGELTACVYNNCHPDRLRVVSDWMNYLFHLDNISDGMKSRDTRRLSDLVMNALEWPEEFKPLASQEAGVENTAARLARDFWSRCIPDCGLGVQRRFKSSTQMFFQAVHQQAQDRMRGRVPDLATYIDMRRDTSGCKPCFDLIEYALGIELPEDVLEHPVVAALCQGANDLVTWSNDIFSYNIEQSRGDTHNMICILMTHERLSLQAAMNRVGMLCKQTIDAFVANLSRLPSWNPQLDVNVRDYVQGLQDWIVGSLHWSFQTYRYFGPLGPQIKATRVVQLFPPRIDKGIKKDLPDAKHLSRSRSGCFDGWMRWLSYVLVSSLPGPWSSRKEDVSLGPAATFRARDSYLQPVTIV